MEGGGSVAPAGGKGRKFLDAGEGGGLYLLGILSTVGGRAGEEWGG